MAVEQAFLRFSTSARGNIGVPLLLLTLLGMMTLPVPPFLLDTLFSFNIALSIVVLLVSVYALRPLEFCRIPHHTVSCHLTALSAKRSLNARCLTGRSLRR